MGDPLDLDGRLLIHRVLQSGKSEIVPRVSEELLPQLTPEFDREPIIRDAPTRSLICVPLVVRSRTFGAMTFILSESCRAYDPADLGPGRRPRPPDGHRRRERPALPGAQGRGPPQGRVPGDAGPRTAQPAGPDLQRRASAAATPCRTTTWIRRGSSR